MLNAKIKVLNMDMEIICNYTKEKVNIFDCVDCDFFYDCDNNWCDNNNCDDCLNLKNGFCKGD